MNDVDGPSITNPENPYAWEHYSIVHASGGMNPAAAQAVADLWNKLKDFEQLAQDMNARITRAIAESWSGQAADAASQAISAFARSAVTTAGQFSQTADCIERTAGAAGNFKMQTPPVINTCVYPPEPDLVVHEQHATAHARQVMSNTYIAGYSAVDGSIPALSGPASPGGIAGGPASPIGGSGPSAPGGQAVNPQSPPAGAPEQPNANQPTPNAPGNTGGNTPGTAEHAGASSPSGGADDQTRASGFEPSAGSGGSGGIGTGSGIPSPGGLNVGGGSGSGSPGSGNEPLATPLLGGRPAAVSPVAGGISRPVAGQPGQSGMPMSGQGKAKDADKEHKTPDYLRKRYERELLGDGEPVSPPVLVAPWDKPTPEADDDEDDIGERW